MVGVFQRTPRWVSACRGALDGAERLLVSGSAGGGLVGSTTGGGLVSSSASGGLVGGSASGGLVGGSAGSGLVGSTTSSGLVSSAASGSSGDLLLVVPSRQIRKCHSCFLHILVFSGPAALCAFYSTDFFSSHKYALFYNLGYQKVTFVAPSRFLQKNFWGNRLRGKGCYSIIRI